MYLDPGILLAALGITMLELAEASAVGLTLFAESKSYTAFLFVAAGAVVVFIPTFLVGGLITLLPLTYIRLTGAVLLLYFGLRLAKSARRSVVRSKKTGFRAEKFERGLMYTGFSVGVIEAFEASIVLVGLIPANPLSASTGFTAGVFAVVIATYILRGQVRKVKQANMKVVVSGLLLTFAAFWFGETLVELNDLVLIPVFLVFALAVYWFANRPVKVAGFGEPDIANPGPAPRAAIHESTTPRGAGG